MLTLIFKPTEEGHFFGSMNYEPEDDNVPAEQQQFYLALGHGILSYATNDTQDVCKRGIELVTRLIEEQEQTALQDKALDAAFDVVV